MADTGKVPISAPYDKWPQLPSAKATEHFDTAPQTRTSTSLNKDALGSFPLIRSLSGKLLNAKEYGEQLRKSSNPGETRLKSSSTVTSNSGSYFVDGVKIPLSLL